MEWRQCAENYEVSAYGEVRNMTTGRILIPGRKGNYRGVCIPHSVYVHHLVATAFLPAPTDKCEIDHIDRNRLNNYASNLRWVSRSENARNKSREVAPRKHNKCGHQYISRIGDKFKVIFHNRHLGYHYSLHDTINDAIQTRDKVINAVQDSARIKGITPVLCGQHADGQEIQL